MFRINTFHGVLVLTCAAGVLSLMGCGGPKKFDSASLSEPSQARTQSNSYWSKQGWWSLPKDGGRKVAITEFTVQYVTNREENMSRNRLGLLMVAEMTGVGKRKYEFEDGFKAKLPTDLYNTFVKELEAAGFTVAPMSAVTSAAAMDKVSAGEEGARKGMSQGGGFFKSDTKQKGELYSVEGLNRMYGGVMGLNEAKHAQL